jgi:uncharacterized Zn finger protein (UPF0148 family)
MMEGAIREARMIGLAWGVGFDAESKGVILGRLQKMTPEERARHLEALGHPADSPEMKASRECLLTGILTPGQEECLTCKAWIPARVQFCNERRCGYWQGRPYAGVSCGGESGPGPVECERVQDGRRCECGKVKADGARFCPACLRDRRRESWKRANARRRHGTRSGGDSEGEAAGPSVPKCRQCGAALPRHTEGKRGRVFCAKCARRRGRRQNAEAARRFRRKKNASALPEYAANLQSVGRTFDNS